MPGSSPKSKFPENVRVAEILTARYYNDAVIALDQLYKAAARGNGTAREMLRSLADRLLDAAGKSETGAGQHFPRSKTQRDSGWNRKSKK